MDMVPNFGEIGEHYWFFLGMCMLSQMCKNIPISLGWIIAKPPHLDFDVAKKYTCIIFIKVCLHYFNAHML